MKGLSERKVAQITRDNERVTFTSLRKELPLCTLFPYSASSILNIDALAAALVPASALAEDVAERLLVLLEAG